VLPNNPKFLILSDSHRGSYKIIGDLFAESLACFGKVEHLSSPSKKQDRLKLSKKFKGSVVLHNTLGEGFVPLANCHNVAMPFHEWSEYPTNWIDLLNEFDEVWTTTDHVREILLRGGLNIPVTKLPPALDREKVPVKKDWKTSVKPSFLFVGEPHFRKGHHLLMQGYLKAFPRKNDAKLTIKTTPGCEWESPREDIELIKEQWSRNRLLSEYSKHDCFVSASLGEGLGLPLTEAIMAELPVCTNLWGGHKCLLAQDGFVEIAHEEILQPFTSNPAFYAEGQKCAYSSPQNVKKALLEFLDIGPERKLEMTKLAKKHLLQTYGSKAVKERHQSHLSKLGD
jgi:glycosyltransferase involved in cell wall biosynthesis